jgi:hypothetical protein
MEKQFQNKDNENNLKENTGGASRIIKGLISQNCSVRHYIDKRSSSRLD